ncbi:MAG: hypothetical protein PG981_000378 [Wolbachia endosymbiont of Ctenocephalides orientis wCori]|nr:MAG: hypothetical protein PG981_000378 [Wolbachia endosymbiont of Ctenocephalides orientis wCori]
MLQIRRVVQYLLLLLKATLVNLLLRNILKKALQRMMKRLEKLVRIRELVKNIMRENKLMQVQAVVVVAL